MPLPDEELAQLRPAGAEVPLDRRGSRRGNGVPAAAPAWLADVELEGRSSRAAPAEGTAHASGAALLAPLKNAARALEPAFVAARAVGERLHRQRIDPAQLLAEGMLLEDAGEPQAAFVAYGNALLAAPLDASPVRALERIGADQRLRLALADLYERVVEAMADHPSATTLRRRAAQLRLLADQHGDAGVDWAHLAAAAAAEERPRAATRPLDPDAPERRASEAAPGGSRPIASDAESVDETQAGALPGEARGGLRLAEAASLGHVLGKWKIARKSEAAGAAVEAAGQYVPGELPAAAMTVLDAAPPAGRAGSEANASAGEVEPEPAAPAAPRAGDDGWDGSFSARTVPLAAGPAEPTAPTIGARLLAWAVDGAVVLTIPLTALGAATVGFARPGVSWIDQAIHLATHSRSVVAASLLLGLLTAFVYLTLGATFGGRTLGGRIAGLRSVAIDHGGSPDFATAALRSAVAIAGTLALLAGPLWAFVDPTGQALHDKVAGTRTLRC